LDCARLGAQSGDVKNRQQLDGCGKCRFGDNTITSHIKRVRRKFQQVDAAFDAIQNRLWNGLSLGRVSIRLQLLIVALTTLVLPWAGCQYARELETALRSSQEQSLLASAGTIANAADTRNRSACFTTPAIRNLFSGCGRSVRIPLVTQRLLDG